MLAKESLCVLSSSKCLGLIRFNGGVVSFERRSSDARELEDRKFLVPSIKSWSVKAELKSSNRNGGVTRPVYEMHSIWGRSSRSQFTMKQTGRSKGNFPETQSDSSMQWVSLDFPAPITS